LGGEVRRWQVSDDPVDPLRPGVKSDAMDRVHTFPQGFGRDGAGVDPGTSQATWSGLDHGDGFFHFGRLYGCSVASWTAADDYEIVM